MRSTRQRAGRDVARLPFSKWGRTAAARPCGSARQRAPPASWCSPSTITEARKRTNRAGSGTTRRSSIRPSPRWTRCRTSAARSTMRAGGRGGGRRRSIPDRRRALAHAARVLLHRRGSRRRTSARRLRRLDPHVARDGYLAIHDVFPDPNEGGRPPYEQIFLPALESGRFRLVSATGSCGAPARRPTAT